MRLMRTIENDRFVPRSRHCPAMPGLSCHILFILFMSLEFIWFACWVDCFRFVIPREGSQIGWSAVGEGLPGRFPKTGSGSQGTREGS